MTIRKAIVITLLVFIIGCQSESQKQVNRLIESLELSIAHESFFSSTPERWLNETKIEIDKLKSASQAIEPKNQQRTNVFIQMIEERYFANFRTTAEKYLANNDTTFRARTQYEMTLHEALVYAKTVAKRNDPIIDNFITHVSEFELRERAAHAESLRLFGDPKIGEARRKVADGWESMMRNNVGHPEFSAYTSGKNDTILNVSDSLMTPSIAAEVFRSEASSWRSSGFTKVVFKTQKGNIVASFNL